MKAERVFFTSLITLDAFFVAFFFGFNSRHVGVIDPTLPPIAVKTIAKPSIGLSKGSEVSQKKEAQPVKKHGDKETSKKTSHKSDVDASKNEKGASKGAGASKASEAISDKGSDKGSAKKSDKHPSEKKTTVTPARPPMKSD